MSLRLATLITKVLLGTLATAAVTSPSITGHWEGAVTRDGAVQVIAVDFSDAPSDARTPPTATIDIPELGMFCEPMSEVRQVGTQLAFRFIYGRFDCLINPDVMEITGVNDKWGPPVKLHLKRLPRLRPAVEKTEIRFQNGAVTLSGTLLRPLGLAPNAAVVCVHGSAQPTREEWTYRGTAFALARSGVAALIFDRRGHGSSTGNAHEATFADFAEDALAAVRYLKTNVGERSTRIGIFGASQGGWIAPLAASKSDDVDFVILHAGASVSVWEQERHRIQYGMKADGASPGDITAALSLADGIFAFARTGEGWDDLARAVQTAKTTQWAKFLQLPEKPADALAWRKQQFDPGPVLRTLRVPVLALFGERDTLVPPAENIEKLKRYLADAGNQDVTIKVFPEVGHGMELQRTLKGDEWNWPNAFWIWPRKAPGYYCTIIEWINHRAKRDK